MSLEFIEINENGVTKKSFDELDTNEKMDLELAIMLNDVKLICVTCLVEIPNGIGFYCEKHKENK